MSITADPHETSTVVLLSFIGWNQGANYVINTPHTNGKLRLYFPPFSVPNKPFGFCGRKATCLLIYYFHIAYFDRFCHPARQSIPPHFDVFCQDFTIQQDSSFLRISPSSKTDHFSEIWQDFTIQQDSSFLRILTFRHPSRQLILPFESSFFCIQEAPFRTLANFGSTTPVEYLILSSVVGSANGIVSTTFGPLHC